MFRLGRSFCDPVSAFFLVDVSGPVEVVVLVVVVVLVEIVLFVGVSGVVPPFPAVVVPSSFCRLTRRK